MKKRIYFLFLIVLLLSCSKPDRITTSLDFINEIFLSIVDTNAYTFRSFFPAPNEPLPPATDDSIRVSLNPYFISLETWEKNILAIIGSIQNKEDRTGFAKMINDYRDWPDVNNSHFTINKISNTGRFSIYSGNNTDNWKNDNIKQIGSLQFSEVLFNTRSDKALLLLIKRDYVKSETVTLFLFKKQEDHWKIFETAVLEIS